MTRALSVHGVSKSFGPVPVLHAVELEVAGGELVAILGPSGCGKTTLLRLIAGFERPDSGTIRIGDRTVCGGHRATVPPERRGVGYVAQEGALFPHLTVAANITFGLPRADRRDNDRVSGLLDLLGMEQAYAGRYPHELSGGQQQRVALARALAPRPALVLLDEPFTALDAGLRAETRRTVVRALARSGTTALLVTHDQAEALSVAGRVAILRDGRLVQTAAPTDLYTTPADTGVASFVGEAVVLPARVRDSLATCALGCIPVRSGTADGAVRLMIRPEQIVIHEPPHGGVSATVQGCTYYGHDATVTLALRDGGDVVTARCSGHALPRPGADVTLTVEGDAPAYPVDAAASQGWRPSGGCLRRR